MAKIETRSLIDEIQQLLELRDSSNLSRLMESFQSRELIHTLSHLSKDEQVLLISLLSPEDAAEVMEEIPDSQAAEIIENLEISNAAAILDQMSSDEQADLILEIDEEDALAILDEMSPEEAEDVRRLITYKPETAGGLMVTEFLIFKESQTVSDISRHLRGNRRSFQKFKVQYIYICDENGMFQGVLQVRDLLIAQPDTRLSEIVKREAIFVEPATPLMELSDLLDTYDFLGFPVLDKDRKMIGVVLRKDLLEAEAERQVMDHLETQGIIGGDELRTMPVLLRSRRRLSWLSVNILLNILAASIIAFHQETVSSVIALAVFLPIISDMSGCSGNQAVAVSMRELSIGIVKPREALRVWFQEMSVGVINGIILGFLIAAAAFLWKGNIYLGIVAGGALAVNTIIAVSIGGTVPLLLKKYGMDPALASGPILTTITDMCGFFLTLTMAAQLLHLLPSI